MVITNTLAWNMLLSLLKNGMFNYLCHYIMSLHSPCVYFTSRDIALVVLSHCNVNISLQPLFSSFLNNFCALRHDAVSLKVGGGINDFV